MGSSGIIDILILAAIALFIGLRLRSVLGQRTGHDGSPDQSPTQPGAPRTHANGDAPAGVPMENTARYPARLRIGLEEILTREPGFTVDAFLEGAKAAHEMILTAFWQGDRAALRAYLAEDVSESFLAAIEEREKAGLTIENKLVEQRRAEVESITVEDGLSEITVQFTAEIIAVTRDAEGNVVEGDVTDAIEVVDIWTFARAIGASDPNWTLIETDAG